jgi:hemerythrin-like domain-containing protein
MAVRPGDLLGGQSLLERLLAVCDAARARLAVGKEVAPSVVAEAAKLVRGFVGDCHERLEEEHLFARLKERKVLPGLVAILERQHVARRRLTDQMGSLAATGLRSAAGRQALAGALERFVRLYTSHEAQEEVVLVPALGRVFSEEELSDLGARFETRERALFGGGGLDEVADRLGALESTLGLRETSATFRARERARAAPAGRYQPMP